MAKDCQELEVILTAEELDELLRDLPNILRWIKEDTSAE